MTERTEIEVTFVISGGVDMPKLLRDAALYDLDDTGACRLEYTPAQALRTLIHHDVKLIDYFDGWMLDPLEADPDTGWVGQGDLDALLVHQVKEALTS